MDVRVAYPILRGEGRPHSFARETFTLRMTRARGRMVSLCCLVWVESGIISETSFERSTGRSASLLGPAVCDHPARINPSSVLGVTAQRFTRLYIFILFFALHRRPTNRGAKLPVFVRRGQFKNQLPKAVTLNIFRITLNIFA